MGVLNRLFGGHSARSVPTGPYAALEPLGKGNRGTEWRSTPSMLVAIPRFVPTLQTSRFESSLATRSQPTFLAPLVHDRSAEHLSGVIEGIAVLVHAPQSARPPIASAAKPSRPFGSVQRFARRWNGRFEMSSANVSTSSAPEKIEAPVTEDPASLPELEVTGSADVLEPEDAAEERRQLSRGYMSPAAPGSEPVASGPFLPVVASHHRATMTQRAVASGAELVGPSPTAPIERVSVERTELDVSPAPTFSPATEQDTPALVPSVEGQEPGELSSTMAEAGPSGLPSAQRELGTVSQSGLGTALPVATTFSPEYGRASSPDALAVFSTEPVELSNAPDVSEAHAGQLAAGRETGAPYRAAPNMAAQRAQPVPSSAPSPRKLTAQSAQPASPSPASSRPADEPTQNPLTQAWSTNSLSSPSTGTQSEVLQRRAFRLRIGAPVRPLPEPEARSSEPAQHSPEPFHLLANVEPAQEDADSGLNASPTETAGSDITLPSDGTALNQRSHARHEPEPVTQLLPAETSSPASTSKPETTGPTLGAPSPEAKPSTPLPAAELGPPEPGAANTSVLPTAPGSLAPKAGPWEQVDEPRPTGFPDGGTSVGHEMVFQRKKETKELGTAEAGVSVSGASGTVAGPGTTGPDSLTTLSSPVTPPSELINIGVQGSSTEEGPQAIGEQLVVEPTLTETATATAPTLGNAPTLPANLAVDDETKDETKEAPEAPDLYASPPDVQRADATGTPLPGPLDVTDAGMSLPPASLRLVLPDKPAPTSPAGRAHAGELVGTPAEPTTTSTPPDPLSLKEPVGRPAPSEGPVGRPAPDTGPIAQRLAATYSQAVPGGTSVPVLGGKASSPASAAPVLPPRPRSSRLAVSVSERPVQRQEHGPLAGDPLRTDDQTVPGEDRVGGDEPSVGHDAASLVGLSMASLVIARTPQISPRLDRTHSLVPRGFSLEAGHEPSLGAHDSHHSSVERWPGSLSEHSEQIQRVPATELTRPLGTMSLPRAGNYVVPPSSSLKTQLPGDVGSSSFPPPLALARPAGGASSVPVANEAPAYPGATAGPSPPPPRSHRRARRLVLAMGKPGPSTVLRTTPRGPLKPQTNKQPVQRAVPARALTKQARAATTSMI